MSVVSVVGAGGIIGPAIVASLAEHDAVSEIRCLDMNVERATEVASEYGGGKAHAGSLDIRDAAASTTALEGSALLLNTAAYRINLDAMRAALRVGAHYLDLGGLFHVTGEQLALDAEFRKADLLAVLGMGSTPGKTNVMAARAVELLGGQVDRIVVGAAGRDPDPPAGPLVAPYAVETILDELSMPTPVVRGGEVQYLEPMSDARRGRVRRSDRAGLHDLHDPLGAGDLPPLVRGARGELPALAEPGLSRTRAPDHQPWTGLDRGD